MNERIQELAEQAREYATTRHPVSSIILSVNSDLFEQKFAELIVQECMNTIDPKTGTKWIKDQTQEEFWKNQSVHLIKKYFGVEE
jgi:hypothetical protein